MLICPGLELLLLLQMLEIEESPNCDIAKATMPSHYCQDFGWEQFRTYSSIDY